ncbi:MAG: branched-chain amino acid ABC transporter permease [Armatimonadota bacterium]
MDARTSSRRYSILVFPIVGALLAALPFVLTNNYHIGVMVFIGIHTILALGLNLLIGYAGQVSLGHAAFYGIGAYTTAILTTALNWPAWIGLLCAPIVTGLTAYLIGMPTLKLKGHYLAMATLGFGMIVKIFFVEFSTLTGGTSGITGIPPLTLGSIQLVSDKQYYYVVWFFALLLIWVSYNIVESRVGRALRAVHTSEIAAASVGVDIAKYKIQVFVLSGVYCGLAGALYAHYIRFVNPDPFGFMFSIQLVVMVVVGGMASIWGAIAGASAITFLSQALQRFEDFEVIVFGAILVFVMIYMPQGLTKSIVDLAGRRQLARFRKPEVLP